ncbi:hypothetical protein DSL92_08460 [Billgrantia gudaonensis]|uniref:Uncharacterized protein n=1 Tax=Billgrantia gudaonensis TaxID=376427 RepID=A0A432JIB7_9GAMM|nr:hypothetical protein DSL92_08460 [Halomonas gudaonensis]
MINRYDIGSVSAGVESFSWMARPAKVPTPPPGFTVKVEATRGDDTLDSETLNYAVVGGVTPTDEMAVRIRSTWAPL